VIKRQFQLIHLNPQIFQTNTQSSLIFANFLTIVKDFFYVCGYNLDSLFSSLTYPIDSMPYIPYSQGKKFDIEAGFIERGLVKFPVFEVKAEPEYYLTGLDHNINEFVPLRIGSMWEAHTKVSWK